MMSLRGRSRLLLAGLIVLLLGGLFAGRLYRVGYGQNLARSAEVEQARNGLQAVSAAQQALAALQQGLGETLKEPLRDEADAGRRLEAITALYGDYAGQIVALKALDPEAASVATRTGLELADVSRRAVAYARPVDREGLTRTPERFPVITKPAEERLHRLQVQMRARLEETLNP